MGVLRNSIFKHWSVFDDKSPYLDRFGPVLALTAVTIATLSLVEIGGAGDPESFWRRLVGTCVGLLIGATLLLALRAAGVERRRRIVVDVAYALYAAYTVLGFVLYVAADVNIAAASGAPSGLWLAFALFTPAAVMRRLAYHRRVTLGTMLGAVAAYLLIALAFCYLFLYINDVQAAAFFASGTEPSTSYMYFSLVTIATLGYGDLVPVTDLGRLAAGTEAVVGNVYLVTFVAMLVGLLIQGRQQPDE
jgi:hypothetical protein